MGIRNYKPTSPGRRDASVADFVEITDRKKQPEKSLMVRITRTGGRNNQGKITARHRGGGARKMYRLVDFRREKDDMAAEVVAIEYDPNRSCRIALVKYEDGEKRYILAPAKLEAGMTVRSAEAGLDPEIGNCMPLSAIPLGTTVHNIEMRPGRGGQICRSAGCEAVLNARESNWAQLTLPSGEVRRVPAACRATIGAVGFSEHSAVKLGKAGRKRHMGWRPRVRGTAMNPVAHPMGGGEGRNAGGRHPCSPTGVLAKGGNTRKRRKNSSKAIVRRRKSRRYGTQKI